MTFHWILVGQYRDPYKLFFVNTLYIAGQYIISNIQKNNHNGSILVTKLTWISQLPSIPLHPPSVRAIFRSPGRTKSPLATAHVELYFRTGVPAWNGSGKERNATKRKPIPLGLGKHSPGKAPLRQKNTTFNGPETGVVFYCCFNGSVFFCITWKCWHAEFSNVFFGAWYAFFRKAIIVPTQHTTSGVGSIHHLSPWPASEAGTSSDVFHPPNLGTPPFTGCTLAV